jgi:D-inositol-3-phosphate glycosyltransferase
MNRKKNILQISYHTCPLASEEGKESGGMNIYVNELSRHLARVGHHVDVITRYQSPTEEKIVEVEPGLRVIHLPAGPVSAIPKKELISYIPEFIQSFETWSAQENIHFDMIHSHYYQSGLIGLGINESLREKLPMAMTFHTLALMKNLVARSVEEQESDARLDAEFRLTKESSVIIAPSTSDAQYLRYLYGVPETNIVEIPPGVNTDIFQPVEKLCAKERLALDRNEKIILFVGRIEPLKGIDTLLYAIKILRAQIPDVKLRLLIVGGDVSQHIDQWSTELRELEQLRHTLDLSLHVDFVGRKMQHELVDYYNAADIVVMPSHYESFGMAAAEAMACGTPVITTNVAGISSLIDSRRDTLITTVNNPLLLASQIRQLLTDPNLYERIRSRMIKNISALAWTTIAKKIDAVYTKYQNLTR